MGTSIYRFPDVRRITGLSRCSIRRLERAGKFPPRIQLSDNAVGWLAEDITQWIEERLLSRARRKPVAKEKP